MISIPSKYFEAKILQILKGLLESQRTVEIFFAICNIRFDQLGEMSRVF